MIYTSPNFWDAHLTADFARYPLWIAEYGIDRPRLPTGWDSWWIWQWRGGATVPGVEKDTDLSRVHPDRSLSSLR